MMATAVSAGTTTTSRRWILDERSLVIEDRVTGSFATAEARFHLHPAIEVLPAAHGGLTLAWADGCATVVFEGCAALAVRDEHMASGIRQVGRE